MTYQQPQQPYYPPPKKRRVWLWVLLGGLGTLVLLFGGCMALVGGAGVAIDSAGKQVHRVTYQVQTDGRPASVNYDTSTAAGTSNASVSHVPSGWSVTVDHAGLLGPNMIATLDLDPVAGQETPGTVTCRILSGTRVVKEASATGSIASVSCNVASSDLEP